MSRHLFYTLFLFLCIAINGLVPSVLGAQSPTLNPNMQGDVVLLEKVSVNIRHGCFLLQSSTDLPLSYNGEQMFIPASIWKLATAANALFTLGEEYRFKTEFYQDKSGDLYIKGYGDPFLVSEEIDLIAKKLTKKLILPIKNFYIDQSAFALEPEAEAWQTKSDNPYDARNYALAVNFNTIHISSSQRGLATSAEAQTPTLAIMQRLAHRLTPGTHRINISQERVDVNAYAGELFLAKTKASLPLTGGQQGVERSVPPAAKRIYSHYSSKNLPEIIRAMFLYSNNFIANQLFLTCGALQYGFPATWHKARMVEKDFFQEEIGLNERVFRITEGSGLARSNMISGLAMLKIVQYLKPYANLLPEKRQSLIKSGTMTDVYSYAGYLKDKSGLKPFVIMLNQKSNTRDKILNILIKR